MLLHRSVTDSEALGDIPLAGADAVSIGVAALIALGDNAPEHDAGYI
jgi:hypothetical protein